MWRQLESQKHYFVTVEAILSYEGSLFLVIKIHDDLFVEKASMKLRNFWPDDESIRLSM